MSSTEPSPLPSAGRLTVTTRGSVRVLVADNPARHNAFNRAMWEALPQRLAEAVDDPAVRVIVLTGAGDKAFCAGADISEFEQARSGAAAESYDQLTHGAFAALSACAKPTIAMIRGFCLGGGLELALCCDIRYAGLDARFSIPAAKLGIGYNPRWIKPMLASVSAATAKEILFTGRRFGADDALRMGLVNRLLSAEDLETATMDLAAEIAANAPLSVYAAKRCVDEFMARPENPDIAAMDELIQACFRSEDYVEGRRAFMAKRPPKFTGS